MENKNEETGFFDNMNDRKIRSAEWQTYTVEGEIDENSDKIFFGGLVISNGKFYFDDFKFSVQNEQGEFELAVPKNAGFEQTISSNEVPNWQEGVQLNQPLRVNSALLLSGPGDSLLPEPELCFRYFHHVGIFLGHVKIAFLP